MMNAWKIVYFLFSYHMLKWFRKNNLHSFLYLRQALRGWQNDKYSAEVEYTEGWINVYIRIC